MSETTSTEEQPITMSKAELSQLLETERRASLVQIKAYIDSGDTIIEQRFKDSIDEAFQTNDYEGMLEIVKLMKEALDGDEAQAGLQAWLNAQKDLKNLKAQVSTNTTDIASALNELASVKSSLAKAQESLGKRITTEIDAVKKSIADNNAAANSRADDIEEAIAADKIAQSKTNSELKGKIDQQQISINETHKAIEEEANARALADTGFNKRVTNNEKAVADANDRMDGFVTRVEMAAYAKSHTELVEEIFVRPNA